MRRTGLALLVVLAVLSLLGWAAPAAALNVGDTVPDFELPATTKDKFKMSDLRGKNVLLFGFVGAWTPT
jgi:hypothetical protein